VEAVMLAVSLLAAVDPVLPGDRQNARGLFALHCAGCHGADGGTPSEVGRSLGAVSLRDPQLIDARTDDQLIALVLKGAPGHPALGSALTLLDAADLVAFLRGGLPAVGDVFPEAAAYTARRYSLSGPALSRAEALAGEDLTAAEKELTVFVVYAGERPATGARLVPQDPVQLDELSPRSKRGYVVFGPVPGGSVAMGLLPDFSVAKLVSENPDVARVAPAVVGKGGREPGKRKAFVSRIAPETARAVTRLYARAVEVAAIAAKEESDRHLFDAPEAAKAPAP
jgi:mono/diheme cytochrome c family protein